MSRLNARQTAVFAAIAVFAVTGAILATRSESKPTAMIAETDTTEAKIVRAMSAGPPEIARSAEIVEKDAQGHTVVLREGSNGFTCMPGNPNVIGQPAMCADGPSMQWTA